VPPKYQPRAPLAQLAEQLTLNQRVPGSSPRRGTEGNPETARGSGDKPEPLRFSAPRIAQRGAHMTPTAPPDEPTPVEHHGCRLVYRVGGDGPPVLLVQGVGVHGDGWRPQVDALAGRFRCLTFDNRGMGRSQPAGGPVTVEQMAEDARALMDARGWD